MGVCPHSMRLMSERKGEEKRERKWRANWAESWWGAADGARAELRAGGKKAPIRFFPFLFLPLFFFCHANEMCVLGFGHRIVSLFFSSCVIVGEGKKEEENPLCKNGGEKKKQEKKRGKKPLSPPLFCLRSSCFLTRMSYECWHKKGEGDDKKKEQKNATTTRPDILCFCVFILDGIFFFSLSAQPGKARARAGHAHWTEYDKCTPLLLPPSRKKKKKKGENIYCRGNGEEHEEDLRGKCDVVHYHMT